MKEWLGRSRFPRLRSMLLLSPGKERKKGKNGSLKVRFVSCSNGLDGVAARGEPTQVSQSGASFVSERRGSNVEQTTSEDELDREILALCGKENRGCPRYVPRQSSECAASNAVEEKPAVAQVVDATAAAPVEVSGCPMREQVEEATPEAVESPVAEETGESSAMTPKDEKKESISTSPGKEASLPAKEEKEEKDEKEGMLLCSLLTG